MQSVVPLGFSSLVVFASISFLLALSSACFSAHPPVSRRFSLAEGGAGTILDGCGYVALLDLGDTLTDGDDGQGSADARDGLGPAEVDVLAVAGLGMLGALAGQDDQALLVGRATSDIGGM